VKPGDLVLVVKLPKFWGGPDVRGKWGTVLEQGAHSERWMVLVEGRRISLHRNHFSTPEEVDAQAR
jgi:hypothetical protein